METVDSGKVVYYSRSRSKLWTKGEKSGHFQILQELRLDCDGDTILLKVRQKKGIACHTGRQTCFFQLLSHDSWVTDEEIIKSSEEIYKFGMDQEAK